MSHQPIFDRLGFSRAELTGGTLDVVTPISGARIAALRTVTRPPTSPQRSTRAVAAFRIWRLVPAPRRGELVRLFGDELRAAKPISARW